MVARLRSLLSVFVFVAFASPATAAAIDVKIEIWLYGVLTDSGLELVDQFAWSPAFGGESPEFEGDVTFLAGPVLTVVNLGNLTTYTLGGGTMRIDAEWLELDGSTGHGSFTAPVLGFDFVVIEDAPPPTGDGFGTLGPGVFDASLAKYLGVAPNALPSPFHISVDVFNPLVPGPIYRSIGTNQSFFNIQAVPVPEPSLSALLAFGSVAAALRRVRRRGATN